MKNEISGRGHELAKAYFGKKPKRKGNDMEQEFDFEDEFEKWNDTRLAIHMGDGLPVYEDEPDPVGKMSLADAREYFKNKREN